MNSVFLDLGIIKIYWYSFLIFVAAIIGCTLAFKEGKKRGLSESFITNYLFYIIPLGIIGARIYYVIFNFEPYRNNLLDTFKIWEGGLAIHGGIIAGLIFTYFYTKKYHIPFFKMTDIVAVSIILCQSIGRWGNFFNQEAYGPVTGLAFLKGLHIPSFIIDGMYINGAYHQPTFLYESLWCFLGFIILFFVRRNKKLILGHLTSIYLIWYGIGRFLIESLRQDSLMFGSLKMAQVISILSMITGFVIIIITSIKNKKYYRGNDNV